MGFSKKNNFGNTKKAPMTKKNTFDDKPAKGGKAAPKWK